MHISPKAEHAVIVIANFVLILAGIAVVTYGIRVFVCDKYPVNTQSMAPTIMPGDEIVVNKLLFGARIYKNLDFLKGDSMESWRIRGMRDIMRNDIVVFNFPYEEDNWQKIKFNLSKVYAKRCIGLPGDSVAIRNGIYGNIHNQLEFSATPDTLIPPVIWNTYPFEPDCCPWNIKNFGPLYVPQKNKQIPINKRNYALYRPLIEFETGKKMEVRGDRLTIGGIPASRYVFQNDYYFMGGDNVSDSQDSRYFGFVPEEFVVGIVTRILYSKDRTTGKIIKDRTLKSLCQTRSDS